jgi:hypothetical protein
VAALAGVDPLAYMRADADERAALNKVIEHAQTMRVDQFKNRADYLANEIANEVMRRIK